MNKVIYTAIIGDYDTLKDPTVLTPGWTYLCYTNNRSITSEVWEMVYVDVPSMPKEDRKFKILPPFQYDICIWIDANIEIKCDLDAFVATYHKGDYSVMQHPDRNCVYQEAEACIRLKKDDPDVINKQMEIYRLRGFPENMGMVSNGIIIRNYTMDVIYLCTIWWAHVKAMSRRDQLSFNFALWMAYMPVNLMPFDITKNEFQLHKHK